MRISSAILMLLILPAAQSLSAGILTNCAAVAALEPPTAAECPEARIVGQILQAQYCRKPPHPGCESYYYLADETGALRLRASSEIRYRVGDIVNVTGTLRFRENVGYALQASAVSILGHRDPPPPVRADLQSIRNGTMDFRIVTTSGLVIDTFRDELDPHYSWIALYDRGTTVLLAYGGPDDFQPPATELLGETVTVTGGCSPSGGGRKFMGSSINTDRSQIVRTGMTSGDPFDAPQLNPVEPFRELHRAHLDGRVLAIRPGNRIILLPRKGPPVEVQFRDGCKAPDLDATVRVAGLASARIFYISILQAVWRHTPCAVPELPAARDTTAREILRESQGNPRIQTDFHGRLICLSGTLTGLPADFTGESLAYLNCDGYIVPIICSSVRDAFMGIEPGSKLAVSGVCQMEIEDRYQMPGITRIKGFSLILRSRNDIDVLSRPSWWTPLRLMILICVLVLLLVTILLWNISLRLIAERRGRELFRENVARISADLRTDERTRLAVDLHDSLAQMLTGVSFQIDAGELEIASKSLKSCRDELRNCLWDLRNQTLEERDMGEAIRRTLKPHIGAAKLLVRFNVPRQKLSDLTAHSVLMIVRELATNAVRHGHAKTIRVAGGLDADELKFSVRDDGCGFDPDRCLGMAEGHFGLQGIRERVKRCDGTVAIESVPGKGTKVTISLKRQK